MYYNSKNEIQPDINVVYKEIAGTELPLSIYLPDNFDRSKKFPAIIAIHGGAWHAITANSPKWDGGVMRHNAIYYARKGFVAITLSYRSIKFTDKTTVADLIDDCNDALGYIKNNFDFIDTQHLILMGDSAGGHLALSLGMNLSLTNEKKYIEPEIIIACNPVTDCLCSRWNYCADSLENCKKLSPMENIKKINAKILLMHGVEDTCVNINDSRIFFNRMKSVGNDIVMKELPNAKHAFILFGYRDSDEVVSNTHLIIDDYLYDWESQQ